MIWAFIVSALILSYLPLINKKISLPNYMWLLIPIDAYGIFIANATIKPYMVFALILPLVLYSRNKGTNFDLSASKGQLFAGIISVLILTHSVFISDSFVAIKGSFLLVLVYICAQINASCTDCETSEQISDVIIASCFGCGAIYIVGYFLLKSGLDIDGIVALTREQHGLFLQTRNMLNGNYIETYRLRGFAYDPNTMSLQFLFGVSGCVSKIIKKNNLYHIVTYIISFVCIVLCGSRMGLICFIITTVITCFVCINQLDNVKKKALSYTSIGVIIISVIALFMTNWGQAKLSNLLSTYTNRSGLTDKYGRFSIWADSLRIFWEKNPIWGVGLSRMPEYTSMERMTHNTWLQFICECGLIIGLAAVVYFFSVMVIGWIKLKVQSKNSTTSGTYLCLLIGYTMTIVALISVDNYTCSYLWFGALLLLKMANYQEKTPLFEQNNQTLS